MGYKKIFVFLLMGIFLMNVASAVYWDNVADFNEEVGEYGQYEVSNSFLGIPLGVVEEVELINNTDTCGISCEAVQEFILYENGTIIDEIKFYTRQEDDSWNEQNIRSYQLYYLDGSDWIPFNESVEFEGNDSGISYLIKLEGEKKPSRTVDWIYHSKGIWLESWAVWGERYVWVNGSEDTTHDPNSYTNVINAFDEDDGTYANKVSGSVEDFTSYLGKTFASNRTIYDIKIKVHMKGLANQNDNELRLEIYNGASWSDVTQLAVTPWQTGVQPLDYEDNYTLNQSVRGIRLKMIGDSGSVQNHNHSVYTLEYQVDGIAYVLLNSPTDNYISPTNLNTFNASATVGGGATLTNMSLYTNETGSWGIRNTTETSSFYPTEYQVAGALHLIKTYDVDNNTISNVDFWLNTTGSQIQIYVHFNYTDGTESIGGIEYTSSTSYENFETNNPQPSKLVEFVSIYGTSTGTEGWFKNVTIEETTSTSTWNRTITDDIIWNVQACDSDGDCGFASSNYSLSIDPNPPSITINTPANGSLLEFGEIGTNQTINVTITDTNLDSCWYNYNETNTTFGTGTCNDFNLTLDSASSLPYYDLVVWANDSIGNINSLSTNWSYTFLETDRVYDSSTVQTSTENFILVLLKDTGVISSSASLTYGSNNYTTIRTTSGNQVNFTRSIEIPASLNGTIPFFWTVSYTNSTGTYEFNTSTSTQQVFNLTLEECFSPSIDGLTLNFTTYDSTNMTVLNTTLEATFEFYAESGSGELAAEYLFSDLNENRTNYMFCLESNEGNVTIDAFISYGATDYDNREYIIDDGLIGNFTQDIPLYLTLTELTDIVTVTVQDQNYDKIAGALVAIQKWNIGTNTYSTIGMFTTSSTGQGIMDLELYNTWYRAVVYIDGEIVKITDVQKLSSTSWTIPVEIGVDNPYDLFGSISSGVTFDNETNITSFSWIDSSGYTSRGCLIVLNHTSLGNVEIQNSCVSSVSGTIDYLIVGEGSYTAYGIIYLEGYNQSQIVDVLSIQLGTPEIIRIVSPFGKVISFLVVGTAGAIGVSAGSAIMGGALVIIVLIALMYWGFLNITWGFVWGIISIMIIVWFVQRRKR